MASTINLKGIKPGTIARTAVLTLALVNQVLATMGEPMIPIEDKDLNALITAGLTVGAAVVAWWHNNSITHHAQSADEHLKALKNGKSGTESRRQVAMNSSSATVRPPAGSIFSA